MLTKKVTSTENLERLRTTRINIAQIDWRLSMDVADFGLFFSEEEAANRLGLKVSTLRCWASRGRGPVRTKIGRRVLYAQSDLKDWISEQRTEPSPAYERRRVAGAR